MIVRYFGYALIVFLIVTVVTIVAVVGLHVIVAILTTILAILASPIGVVLLIGVTIFLIRKYS